MAPGGSPRESVPLAPGDRAARARLARGTGVLWFVAGLTTIIGALGVTGQFEVLRWFGVTWASIGERVTFVALAVTASRRRSRWTFGVAMALLVGDGAVAIGHHLGGVSAMVLAGLAARALLLK